MTRETAYRLTWKYGAARCEEDRPTEGEARALIARRRAEGREVVRLDLLTGSPLHDGYDVTTLDLDAPAAT